MNPLIGIPPHQVNKDDPMVSYASKWEHAKSEITHCLWETKKSKDPKEIDKLKVRLNELQNYMIELEEIGRRQKKGCYIATHLYGSYNHPKVKILRIFRDTILSKTMIGNRIISYYYEYAPSLVNRMEGKEMLNRLCKAVLDFIIRVVKLFL